MMTVSYAIGTASFEQQDWLGTERMVTGYTGSVEGTYTSLPFGDGFQVTGSDPDQYHFAGLDYEYKVGTNGGALARFRMYYNTAGRWMSPDLYSGSYDFTNPQSFDRYSYTSNNPLSFTDPSGQFTCPACTAPTGFACPWCEVGELAGGLIYDLGKLFCWWGCHAPAFHGSVKPRPNAQPWDENHIHWWNGANLASAFGLPDETCEFGACGPGPSAFGPGDAGGNVAPIDLSAWVFQIYAFARLIHGSAPNNANQPSWQQKMRQAVHSICGKSPGDRVAKSVLMGAGIGAVTGGIGGFVGGEVFGGEVTLGATGPVGAFLGAHVGAAVGAVNGLTQGAVLAGICYAGFQYDN